METCTTELGRKLLINLVFLVNNLLFRRDDTERFIFTDLESAMAAASICLLFCNLNLRLSSLEVRDSDKVDEPESSSN